MGFSAAVGVISKLANCPGGRTMGCRGRVLWSLRKVCVHELMLTKEKFYKGAKLYLCGDECWSCGVWSLESGVMTPESGSGLRGVTGSFVTVPSLLRTEVPR